MSRAWSNSNSVNSWKKKLHLYTFMLYVLWTVVKTSAYACTCLASFPCSSGLCHLFCSFPYFMAFGKIILKRFDLNLHRDTISIQLGLWLPQVRRTKTEIEKGNIKLQRVPVVRGFWDFKKPALRKFGVNGTVGRSSTNAGNPLQCTVARMVAKPKFSTYVWFTSFGQIIEWQI